MPLGGAKQCVYGMQTRDLTGLGARLDQVGPQPAAASLQRRVPALGVNRRSSVTRSTL